MPQPAILCLTFVLLRAAAFVVSGGKPFVDSQSLVVERGGERVVLKTLTDAQEFQGFGDLEDGAVFMAYSTDTEGGASTMLSVYDFARHKELLICELGATGESAFVMSPDGSRIAFNWEDGIYLASTRGLLASLRKGPVGCERFRSRFRLVVKCNTCYEPEWVGPATIRYNGWERDEWRMREVAVAPEQ
ncbi:MAG TPA: hypothetical protein VEK79_01135 [Thermoanaerobaculia bacterium]|nr:hypothetical protein [Thermoanaerobaculia bacterium]